MHRRKLDLASRRLLQAKKGTLTEGLMRTHKCRERECGRLDEGVEFE